MDPIVARKMWRTLEPYHGLIYFAPEAEAAYDALGVHGRDGYFASRAAAMGAVSAEVVIATFFNFNPEVVQHAIPRVWDAATPEQLVSARLSAADAALRRSLGQAVDAPEMARAAELARAAAEACPPEGRPLFAGQSGLPWPDAPHLAVWHAVSLTREFRGDGHIAALVDAHLGGVDALVLHAASGEVTRAALQTTRGWRDEAWHASVERLAARGLVDGDGAFTDAGAALRQHIEDRTDAAALAPWETIGEDGCDELRSLVRPLSRAIVDGDTFRAR